MATSTAADDLRAEGLKALQEAAKGTKGTVVDSEFVELSAEKAAELREEKIARFAQVLDRGILNDKLAQIIAKCVPEGRRGKFIRDREEDVIRYSNLGYTFDVVEGSRGLHATGDNRVRVGDLVLMTISAEDHGILKEGKKRLVQKKLGLGKQDYLNRAAERVADGVVPFNESQTIIG